jgi:hypothetical protein
MRKLSVGPFLILLLIFLWNHFASASSSKKLTKTLPAKKTKIIMNFDQPALPPAPSVVIREAAPSTVESDVEAVQAHDVTEAPSLEIVGPQAPIEVPNTAHRKLRPALPDSDSFVVLPPGLKRAPQQPRASVFAAPPPPTVAPPPPMAPQPVVAQPLVQAAAPTPMPAPEPQPVPAPEAAPAPAPEPMPTVALEPKPTAQLPSEIAVGHKSTDGKLAVTVIDETPAMKATFLVPRDEIPRRRVFIRGGYLDAKYDKLESDLKNGATLLGVSVSQLFSQTEVRLGIDVAHGLDQAVNLRNTRMAMFRAEGLFNVAKAGLADFYVGGALGIADVDVTSYRQTTTNGDVVVRQNAKGTALLAAPEVGARIHIGRQVSLDLTLQYLLLAGGDQIANLGGTLGEAALGFRF